MNGISTPRIAVNNIAHRRFRSLCIVLLTAISTLLITGGTFLGFGLQSGIESVETRLGADAMLVPLSAGESFEGALLSGSPSTFYLSADAANRVSRIGGIERSTPQLFISSFDSVHCTAPVQVIGYDPGTDFVIAPWFEGSEIKTPQYGEIVVGTNVRLGPGDDFWLFGVTGVIVGKLDKTGMGFDNSVFVNMETAQMLLDEYEKYDEALPLPEGADADDVISAVLFDFDRGADLIEMQRQINDEFRRESVRYVSSQTLIENVSKNLTLVIGILSVLLTVIWAFAAFVLAVIFALTLNERQREFGVLRAIGATRRKLSALFICESALLSGVGAAFGVGVVCLIVTSYGAAIEHALRAAYLPPDRGAFVAILALCFVLGASVGPLASLFSVKRISGSEAFENIREGV
jgi:putative ABC transport system permease protein